MAQEASAKVTVAGVGSEKKKKTLQRREKGWKEKRESRGGSLVVSWWSCWLPVVELVFGVGMVVAEGHGGERGKKECLAEERKTFTVAYYRHSGGWSVFLATLGGAGCSRWSWRKKWCRCWFPVAEEERIRNRRRKSAAGRGRKADFLA